MRNIKLTISYDGTRYRGWQRLSGVENTIQGKLESALSGILQEEITLFGSGRTDAGVHAKGQVANFHCQNQMPCQEILSQLRRYLPEDIGIESCSEAGERFHSRLNAVSKTYCYRVWNSDAPCVFERKYVYRLPEKLDDEAMKLAAAYFLGTHDFQGFCSNKHYKKSTVRTIYRFAVERLGHELRFTVHGDGFLYNMVRILVGTVLEVGMGRMEPGAVLTLLSEKNRALAGYTVPAKGLCLMEVQYQ